MKLFEYTKDFPREYRFTLGQDMKRDGIVLVRSAEVGMRSSRHPEIKESLCGLIRKQPGIK